MTSSRKIKSIFTLRGHNVSVTALDYCQLPDDRRPCLVSGDEEGTLVFWNLATFKRVAKFDNIAKSTIQSIKNVNLIIGDKQTNVLVVQSRDDGVQVLDFYELSNNSIRSVPTTLASFPTYDSLFSRGDAKSTKDGRAILAHPSLLENYLVTIRILGRDAKTEHSGTAGQHRQNEKSFPVFDVAIRSFPSESTHHLFVAYEDGRLSIFEFRLEATKTVPVLNSEGLDINLIKNIDLNFRDFVAAFDVTQPTADHHENYLIVAGSPGKELCFLRSSLKFDLEPDDIKRLRLKTNGISAISMRPDARLVAVACWDKSVRFYSIEPNGSELVATLDQHAKQVQAILFAPNPTNLLMDLGSVVSDNGFLVCCASQDGTVSISSTIY